LVLESLQDVVLLLVVNLVHQGAALSLSRLDRLLEFLGLLLLLGGELLLQIVIEKFELLHKSLLLILVIAVGEPFLNHSLLILDLAALDLVLNVDPAQDLLNLLLVVGSLQLLLGLLSLLA
jgi:hypothetical protein